MRNYNAVAGTLEITRNPGKYVTIERYKEGQQIASLIYLPMTYVMKNEEMTLKREIKCLNVGNYDVVALNLPRYTPLIDSKFICLFAHNFKVEQFNECDKTKTYWICTSMNTVGNLRKVDPLNIDTLYVNFPSPLNEDAFNLLLYDMAEVVRRHNIKHIMIGVTAIDVAKGILLNFNNPLTITITFIIHCGSEQQVPYALGIKNIFKENGKQTSRFVLPNNMFFDNCNQYFYQDNAFVQFSTVSCTNDDVDYNVIYYLSHRKLSDITRHIDLMKIIAYQRIPE